MNPINKNNNINIELTHLDSLTKNTLKYFLQSNLCKHAKISKSPAMTDLFIVDSQKIIGTNFLNEMKGSNKTVIILCFKSENLTKHDNILLLAKPLDTIKLIELIDQVHSSLKGKQQEYTTTNSGLMIDNDKNNVNNSQHSHLFNALNAEDEKDIHQRFKAQKFVGTNKDIEVGKDSHDKIFIAEEKYLYYHLNKVITLANSNKSNIILQTFSAKIIYLYKEKIFLHDMEANKLKLVQSAPLSTDVKHIFIKENKTFHKEGFQSTDKDVFIWASAIQASKGRLPNYTNIEKSVILNTWPNFSQLQVFRYSVQITAVWSMYNLSLVETAKQLQIPQRYVFTLYFAMNSLGYAEIDSKNKNKGEGIQSKTKHTNKSLFSKILSHVFNRQRI